MVVALVAVVVTVARESDVERPAAPPGKKVVATDVERGVRFSLDGRVLTVQLLPPGPNQTFETVSGARDQRDLRRERRRAAGCSAARDHAHPALAGRPDEPELPLPARRLELVPALRPVRGNFVFVSFPGASPGPTGPITETANNWARLFASGSEICADYMGQTACEQVNCQRVGGMPIRTAGPRGSGRA